MKKRQAAVISIGVTLCVALMALASEDSGSLGTEESPILLLVPHLVDPERTVEAAAEIAQALSAETGLIIAGEAVSVREMGERMASADGRAFGILDAACYVAADVANSGVLVPRLAGLKDGYDYTFSNVYVRRKDGYSSLADLVGGQWAHSSTAASEAVPRAIFDTMRLSFAEGIAGWETGALVVLLFNEQIGFATGFGAPPLPPPGWSGPDWAYGDPPERWIWDEDFLALYPADVRGTCKDLRAATALPQWLGDEDVWAAMTLERLLSEIGVLASFGPIPNECIAFTENFPQSLADRITAAIAQHVVSQEGAALWGDRRFIGWTDTKEIDDSYYDAYRVLVGAPTPKPHEEVAAGPAGSPEDASLALSDAESSAPGPSSDGPAIEGEHFHVLARSQGDGSLPGNPVGPHDAEGEAQVELAIGGVTGFLEGPCSLTATPAAGTAEFIIRLEVSGQTEQLGTISLVLEAAGTGPVTYRQYPAASGEDLFAAITATLTIGDGVYKLTDEGRITASIEAAGTGRFAADVELSWESSIPVREDTKVFPGSDSGSIASSSDASLEHEQPAAGIPLPEGSLYRIGDGSGRVVACQPRSDVVAVGTTLGIELRRITDLRRIGFLPSENTVVDVLTYSHSGSLLAAGYRNGDIRIWDLQSREVLRTIKHDRNVTSIAFDSADRLLAAGAGSKTIKIWDVASGAEVKTIEDRRDGYAEWTGFPVAFKGDGITLATGSEDGMVKLWNYQTGDLVASVHAHDEAVMSLCFDSMGTYLLSRDGRTGAAIWAPTNLEEIVSFELSVRPYGSTAQFSADGQSIVTQSGDALQYLSITDGSVVRELSDHNNEVAAFSETANGDSVVALSSEGEIFVYDAHTGDVSTSQELYGSGFTAVALHPRGEYLACGLSDGLIEMWNTANWTRESELTGHTYWVVSLVFDPSGEQLASGCWDGTAKLWNWRTENETSTLGVSEQRVYDVAYSPDGELLATASSDGLVRLWDADTHSLLQELAGHPFESEYHRVVSSVEFTPDGKQLASGAWDDTVKLWDVESREIIQTLATGNTGYVHEVAFSPSGRFLAVGRNYDSTDLWDVATGQLMHTFRPAGAGYDWPGLWVQAVAFHPQGSILATGYENGVVAIWDVARRELVELLNGHTADVLGLAFSADGSTLASASSDGSILIWDTTRWTSKWLARDVAGGGRFTSASLGNDGMLRVAHWAAADWDLLYTTHGEKAWETQVVAADGRVGRYACLAVDSNGVSRLAFEDASMGVLKYAYLDEQGWSMEVVDTCGAPGFGGSYIGLALGEAGTPHVCYCSGETLDLKYAARMDGVWQIETVDLEGKAGVDSSLAIAEDGTPHIAYVDGEACALKYATKADGKWHTETLDRGGHTNSIRLDSTGRPVILYYNNWSPNGGLKYAWHDGMEWRLEIIRADVAACWYASLALDSEDRPHVAFHEKDAGLRYAFEAEGVWQSETIEDGENVGAFNSIAVDDKGGVHVTYWDRESDRLKYAYRP
jgi:WD40 repeat protein